MKKITDIFLIILTYTVIVIVGVYTLNGFFN